MYQRLKISFMPCISDCYWLLDALLEFTTRGTVPPSLAERASGLPVNNYELPDRMEGKQQRSGWCEGGEVWVGDGRRAF